MNIKMDKAVSDEIRFKLGVLLETPDLMEDYAVTASEVEKLIASVPSEGSWEIPQEHFKMVRDECADSASIMFDIMVDSLKAGDDENAKSIGSLLDRFDRLFKEPVYTHPLYVSPARDRNRKKYGESDGNYCVCCYKPMKEGETLMVHMNEDWVMVSNEVSQERCKEVTGANSQGNFNIGNSCAKKIPKEFLIGVA